MVYDLHVTTSWVKCPLWVNQRGQLSLPSLGVVKWVAIRVITWITEVETINGRPGCVWPFVVGQSPWAQA